jgi:hypothetical protein
MDIEQGWKATLCNYLSAPESITSCLIGDVSINCFLGKKRTRDGKPVSIASCLLGRDIVRPRNTSN